MKTTTMMLPDGKIIRIEAAAYKIDGKTLVRPILKGGVPSSLLMEVDPSYFE